MKTTKKENVQIQCLISKKMKFCGLSRYRQYGRTLRNSSCVRSEYYFSREMLQIYRPQAAIKAGIDEDNIYIALEPEAAAIHVADHHTELMGLLFFGVLFDILSVN